jgi:hypothetical protein
MKNFNEYTKQEIIKSVQNNMNDSEGTQDYLESLTKDELRTLLIQFVVNKDEEKLAKHRANLDKMKYESYINFSRSHNLK